MTHPTHDFKKTLDKCKELGSTASLFEVGEEAILFALKLAEKVCGEPSEDAVNAAIDRLRIHTDCMYKSIFTSMRQQMLKEIGEGE